MVGMVQENNILIGYVLPMLTLRGYVVSYASITWLCGYLR